MGYLNTPHPSVETLKSIAEDLLDLIPIKEIARHHNMSITELKQNIARAIFNYKGYDYVQHTITSTHKIQRTIKSTDPLPEGLNMERFPPDGDEFYFKQSPEWILAHWQEIKAHTRISLEEIDANNSVIGTLYDLPLCVKNSISLKPFLLLELL